MKKVVLLQLKGGCKKRDVFLQPPCFSNTDSKLFIAISPRWKVWNAFIRKRNEDQEKKSTLIL